MPLKIIKASAGSGKTYTLTREYIKRLLQTPDPRAYRHILAVTFTNKATAEMKQRILSELYTLATNTNWSPYYKDFVPAVCHDTQTLRNKAKAILSAILYDYSAFAVGTIDSFFQKTLRAFAHETGRDGSYRVDLDREALVDEAVDRVMSTIDEPAKATARQWITEGVAHDLEVTGKYNAEKRLRDLAMSLTGGEGASSTILGPDELKKASDECDAVTRAFTDDVRKAAMAVDVALRADGLAPSDFNRAFPKSVIAYGALSDYDAVKAPSEALLGRLLNPDEWFAAAKLKAGYRATGRVARAFEAFAALFGDRYGEYVTALAVRNECLVMRMAGELKDAFEAIQKEKNVVTIDRTNSIIKDIIDGSDAPFIYERLGVRFEDFLLDEFQDTSDIQWGNFLPLLRNGLSEGGETLLVGDVKQSIYRWRGSDWRLLGERADAELGDGTTTTETLGTNYRSLPAVVEFNNDFFGYAAAAVDAVLGFEPDEDGSVSSIYADVRQKAAREYGGEGSVGVRFAKDTDEEMDMIVEAVRRWKGKGMGLGDMAVLVRGNAEGQAVAARLLEEGIPVMSDESLTVKSSAVVRRIVAGMTLALCPAKADGKGRGSVAAYISRMTDLKAERRGNGLFALAEDIVGVLSENDREAVRSESAFVFAFMDYVREWSANNGDNLSGFLRDWEKADVKIASPDKGNAVRVMTIHKSKGLEFPLVIVPFLEKTSLYRNTSRWCRPKASGTGVAGLAGGDFCVTLSESSSRGLFRDVYIKERYLQAVDNINIAYVALTRASDALEIIALRPGKTYAAAFEKGVVPVPKDFAQMMYAYLGGEDCTRGAGPAHPGTDWSPAEEDTICLDYACSPDVRKSRLVLRSDGTGRFRTPDPETDQTEE